MTEPQHPSARLQDALDGRLTVAERAALDAHLATCPACRRELEALSWVKRQIADTARDAVAIPDDLTAGILRTLDAEDRGAAVARPAEATTRPSFGGRTWAAAAAAAIVLAFVWFATRPHDTATPEQVASDLRAFAAGSLVVDLATVEPQVLEARLQAAGLSFSARVFDFGMMNYRLVGGGVHRVARQPSALFAYEGPGELRLLCQMYEGTVTDLPPPPERRTNDGVDFLVYREGDVTVVFWQEGKVVCVLSANGDSEAAIKLAFAKAVRI